MSDFLSNYETQNIIAIVALILAYLAYRKSITNEYKEWVDLAKSFRSELSYAKEWIGNSYNGTFLKDWEDPSKIIFPLTAEAVKALIQRGHPPTGLFPDDFFDKLTKYNERINAFNHLLFMQGMNYVMYDKEKYDESIEKATHINNTIHNHLIGNEGEFHLHDDFEYFCCELNRIENCYTTLIPWYFRYPKLIIVCSLIIYIFADFWIN